MRRALGGLVLVVVLAGCTPAHHLYPCYYDSTVEERYQLETPYDRYWKQNHQEGFGFRIQPYRMVNASSTGSERSR
jgi:hypothetical protein